MAKDSKSPSCPRRPLAKDSKSPSCPRRRPLRRMFRKLLLLAVATTIVAPLLIGHRIYPSAPLLSVSSTAFTAPNNNDTSEECASTNFQLCQHEYCHRRVKLSMATASFVLATSLRTMVLAPVTRLQNLLPLLSTPIINGMEQLVSWLERYSWDIWEDVAKQSNVWDADRSSSYHAPPEIDLDMLVPCDQSLAREYLLHSRSNGSGNNEQPLAEDTDSCRLRDIINRELLLEYITSFYGDDFDLATHPVILRNLWPPESFADDNAVNSGQHRRRLTPKAILNDPQLSNLLLPNYFSDSTQTGYDALVPDEEHITLSDFLRGILSGNNTKMKIGTQLIVDKFPELREEIMPSSLAKELFGWYDYRERIRTTFTLVRPFFPVSIPIPVKFTLFGLTLALNLPNTVLLNSLGIVQPR